MKTMKQYVIILIGIMHSFFIQTMEKQTIYCLEKKNEHNKKSALQKTLQNALQETLPSLLQKVDEAYYKTNDISLSVFEKGETNRYKELVEASNKYTLLKEKYKNVIAQFQYAIEPSIRIDNTIKITRALIPTLLFPNIRGKQITTLCTSRNNLTDLPLGFLLQQMPNLENVNVSHNNISYLSTIETTDSKLKNFDISFNLLKTFDLQEFLSKNSNIEYINLASNPLNAVTLNNFPKDLVINLSSTNISFNDQKNIRNKYVQYAQCDYKKELEKEADEITTCMTCSVGAVTIHAITNFFNADFLMEMVLTFPTVLGLNYINRSKPREYIKKSIYTYLEKKYAQELHMLAQKQTNIIF